MSTYMVDTMLEFYLCKFIVNNMFTLISHMVRPDRLKATEPNASATVSKKHSEKMFLCVRNLFTLAFSALTTLKNLIYKNQ